MWMFVSDYRFFSSHGNAFLTRSSSEFWRMWGKVLRTNLGKQKSASFPALLPYVSLPELHLSSAQLFPPKDQHQIFLLYWLTDQFDMWVKNWMGNKKYIILIFNCLALEKKFSVQTKCLPSKYFPYVKKCTFTVGWVKVLCKKNRPFHWGKLYFSVFRAILRIREESKAW